MRLDHIAIAVRDIQAAITEFESALGIPCEKIEAVPTERVTVAFFDLGGPHIELTTPLDPEDTSSPIARSIEKRGEGLHHISLEVEDIDTALAALKAKGVRLINETATPGAKGS